MSAAGRTDVTRLASRRPSTPFLPSRRHEVIPVTTRSGTYRTKSASGPRPDRIQPVAIDATMKAAEPQARALAKRSRLSPASSTARVSERGIMPPVPTARADSAAASPSGSWANARAAAPAAAIRLAPRSTRLTSPTRSASAPHAGATTRLTTLCRASRRPIAPSSRPRDARNTDEYGKNVPSAPNSAM